MKKLRNLLVLLVVIVLVAGACGDDDDNASSTGTTEKAAAQPEKIAVSAKEESGTKYSFAVPATIKGGLVDITLQNTGKRPHDFQLIKLDSGTTDQQANDFVKSLDQEGGPIPDYVHPVGGTGTAAPGAASEVKQKLDKGDYLYFCTESDEEDAPPDVPKGSHASKGMQGRFTVSDTANDADLQETDAKVSATEYKFTTSGLKAGENEVTFENTGAQYHHFFAAPISQGKTIEDVKTFLSSQGPPQGPPPIDFEKGTEVAVTQKGADTVSRVTFPAAGKYAMLCFINDKAGGPPHFTKGMLQEVDIS